MRVILVYDPDEAGARATESAADAIATWTHSWGVPLHAGPTAMALAAAQQEYDRLARRWATLDFLTSEHPLPSLQDTREEAHAALEDVADYVLHLADRLGDDRPYLQAANADEYIESEKPHRVVEDIRNLDWAARKERIDLVAFVERLTDLRQRGRSLQGSCPLPTHEDSTPSFHVYPAERNWYCFGCGRWGDVFDLARALDIPIDSLS